jgi:hypothetical protein
MGCRVTLIIESGRFVPGAGWRPQPEDPQFPWSGGPVSGSAIDGPDVLVAGTYTVGIGISEYSDIPTPGAVGFMSSRVVCARSFSFGEGTSEIAVRADFEANCRITITADGVSIPDDCATADVSALLDSGSDRVDTSVDADHDLMDISIVALDVVDYVSKLTVRYTDESCRSHPLIGPIINSVLVDRLPPATPRPRANLVGRLIATEPELGCSILLDSDGNTWDIDWPTGYTLISSTPPRLEGPNGTDIVSNGDLVGVLGAEAARELRGCLARTRYRVDQIVFAESPTP